MSIDYAPTVLDMQKQCRSLSNTQLGESLTLLESMIAPDIVDRLYKQAVVNEIYRRKQEVLS